MKLEKIMQQLLAPSSALEIKTKYPDLSDKDIASIFKKVEEFSPLTLEQMIEAVHARRDISAEHSIGWREFIHKGIVLRPHHDLVMRHCNSESVSVEKAVEELGLALLTNNKDAFSKVVATLNFHSATTQLALEAKLDTTTAALLKLCMLEVKGRYSPQLMVEYIKDILSGKHYKLSKEN